MTKISKNIHLRISRLRAFLAMFLSFGHSSFDFLYKRVLLEKSECVLIFQMLENARTRMCSCSADLHGAFARGSVCPSVRCSASSPLVRYEFSFSHLWHRHFGAAICLCATSALDSILTFSTSPKSTMKGKFSRLFHARFLSFSRSAS